MQALSPLQHRQAEQARAALERDTTRAAARPPIARGELHAYLDWIASTHSAMLGPSLATHLQLAELGVRLEMGEAQAKDNQHTLIRDGIIDPPPTAS